MKKKKETAKASASFADIALNQIKPNPANPRKRGFDGAAFEELVASIRSVGVLEPVLVRAKGKGFELIAGERRYRACCAIAEGNGGIKTGTIPAIIRDLDDAQAFEAMMIENLQREDLSELEEAESFKAWVDKRGPESLEDLAQRTGIHPGYIRRRIAVLELPAAALKAWDKGKLRYGHLEVLIQVHDEKRRADLLKNALEWNRSAKDLRRMIEEQSPPLKKALFDPDQDECPQCHHNSEKQKKLFALEDAAGAVCMKPACFKQKQNNWLSSNWKASELRRKYKTNGFRFYQTNLNGTSFYGDKPLLECKSCEKFVSVIGIDGEPHYTSAGRYCLDPKCKSALDKKRDAEKRKQKTPAPGSGAEESGGENQNGEVQGSEPRVGWHGSHFREEFFKTVLPDRLRGIDPLDPKALIIAVLALVRQNPMDLEKPAAKLLALPGAKTSYYYRLPASPAIEALREMICLDFGKHQSSRIAESLQQLVAQVVMSRSFSPGDRRAVSEFIGIDLKAEWRITEEYLQKKTKAEIMAIIDQFGIRENEAAKSYLYEKLMKKRGRFESCKKPELVELLLKSGIDLAGIVPEEILRVDEQPEPILQDDEPFCRVCGCTEDDCSECVEVTGEPCHWIEPDLCSRCAAEQDHNPTTEAA